MPTIHSIKIPVKASDSSVDSGEVTCDVPILAPHEVLQWLTNDKYVIMNDPAAERFWAHHQSAGTPWLGKAKIRKDGYTVHPVSLYGDEAEYTQTKEKILMVFISYFQALSLS